MPDWKRWKQAFKDAAKETYKNLWVYTIATIVLVVAILLART